MKIPATWTERDVITTTSSSSSLTNNSKTTKLSKPSKPQQCLRFAPTIEVAEIPNRYDYSREEIESVWFQSYDYEEFRENAYMTMGLYRAGLLPGGESHEHTMRGLEGRLLEVAREREQTRYHATSAVLNEQYRQYNMGYRHPQAIADLYHAVSWKSQYNAYTQAMVDEQQEQQRKAGLGGRAMSPRRSDAKNLLRKIIDIERVDEGMDASCPSSTMTLFPPPATMNTSSCTTTTDFDINSFFQELTIAAQ